MMILNQFKNLPFSSYGTFGFWSAYLKGSGDVILASGSSLEPTYVEVNVRPFLLNWIFLNDPCYTVDTNGSLSLLNECVGLT